MTNWRNDLNFDSYVPKIFILWQIDIMVYQMMTWLKFCFRFCFKYISEIFIFWKIDIMVYQMMTWLKFCLSLVLNTYPKSLYSDKLISLFIKWWHDWNLSWFCSKYISEIFIFWQIDIMVDQMMTWLKFCFSFVLNTYPKSLYSDKLISWFIKWWQVCWQALHA